MTPSLEPDGRLTFDRASRQLRHAARPRPESILLVDDDDWVRAVVTQMLQRMGFAVATATSGRDAIRMVEAGELADLWIIDVVMTGMNGRDTAARLRELRPEVPTLYISGYSAASPDQLHTSLELDAPCLAKPFTSSTLYAAVTEVLDRRQSGLGR